MPREYARPRRHKNLDLERKIVSYMQIVSLKGLFSQNWIAVVTATACLALLVTMIATSPSRLCYDEVVYQVEQVQMVRKVGWRTTLTSPNEISVGPLYAAIQLSLAPLTGLQAPSVRWVNLVCFAAVLLIIAREDRATLFKAVVSATTLLAVPFLWPAVGMALTEIPALLFFTIFIFFFLRVINSEVALSIETFGRSVAAGLCLGIAILGRQTYLAAMPVVLAMVFWLPGKWPVVLTCFVTALAVCGWLFLLWGGLAPPSWYYRHSPSSFSLTNGMLSLSYAAAATIFLNPQWMRVRRYTAWIGCSLVGIVFAFFGRDYANPPARSLLILALGDRSGLLIGFVIGCALAVFGVIWAWNTFLMAWQVRQDPRRIFLLLTLIALVLTPMKITHQFSSRYVVGLLGVLFLVVGAPRELRGAWAGWMLVGSSVGAAILWTYFADTTLP
jgi:hypothetical protein